MITLNELVAYLDQYLEVSDFIDFSINGLQVEGRKTVRSIATAVSANLETIEQAVAEGHDALIVHHGLFWNKDGDSLRIVGSKQKKLRLLLNNEISLLTYHLPLDAHYEVGNNWKAARDLGWQQLAPFGFYNNKYIGVKGTFHPIEIETFKSKIEKYYHHFATVALKGKKLVSSAALISGAAYKELLQAAKENIDCFITGNFDEPAWSMAQEEQIHFLALGHSATETVGPKALAAKLSQQFEVACVFLDIPNPF